MGKIHEKYVWFLHHQIGVPLVVGELNPRRALLYWFLGQPISLGSQIFIMIYTARVLGPEEKGLFVAAVSALAFLQVLQNFGLGAFFVSETELTKEDIATSLGILLIGCSLVSFVTYVIALPLANYMRDPRLIPIFHVLAIAPLFMPLQMIAIGLMMREHRDRVQVVLALGRAVISALVVFALCENGFGAISLAWSFVSGCAVVTVLSVIMRPSVMLIRPSLVSWRKLLRFGASMLALTYLVNLLPRLYEFLITRSLGVAATGLFSQMFSLVDPIKANIQQVVLSALFPTIAEQIRRKQSIGPLYLKLLECLTGLLIPIYVVMAILGEAIVYLLFGAEWVQAANILIIVYCAQIVLTLSAGAYSLLLALGRLKTLLLIETVNFVFSLFAFWIGLHVSLTMALYLLILASILYSIMYSLALVQSFSFTYKQLLKIYCRTAFVATAAAVPALMVNTAFAGLKLQFHHFILIGFMSFAFAYFAGSLVRHSLIVEIDKVGGHIWMRVRKLIRQRPR